jgi:LPXTG-motif cell wall-anchored protein
LKSFGDTEFDESRGSTMKRRFLAIAASALAATAVLAPTAAHAGGVNVVAGVCARDGVTLTWKHLDEAARDEATGVIRTIQLISVTTFEATPRVLTATEISKGVWKLAPFNAVGDVVIDVALLETITPPPPGPVSTNRSTPRVSFTCTAPPPPPTTTAPPTTAPAPAPTADPTPAPTPAPTVVLPIVTIAGPTTTVSSAQLPATGSSDMSLVLAASFLLLAGFGLTLTARREV